MCGWKQNLIQEDHTHIPNWVYQDNGVKNALGCVFSDTECAAMFPRLGMHCKPNTKKQTKNWVLQVDDYTNLPVRQLRHKTGPIDGAVQLEFASPIHLDHTHGGYFIEITPSEPWSGQRHKNDVSQN